MHMLPRTFRISLASGLFLVALVSGCKTAPHGSVRGPLHALLITGGCCHNYPMQTQSLVTTMSKHASVEWTVVNEGGSGTRAMLPFYDNPNWAKNFDVVVHNECFADTDSPDYIRKITAAHRAGVPAVVIHCAMHTYRAAGIDDWREFLGVTSRRHDHQSRYPVTRVQPNHPILRGVPEGWVTPMDELYVIEKLWPNAQALATSVSERDGNAYPVAWINQYGKARVFGTTYGHSEDTFRDPVYLDLLCRGVLWAAGASGK
ncbi:MAG: ThuA domain-containing protein [Pedosphaera sp.]|nr:ThuA domain-containing protein [Pedosphaera sp.]